VMLRQMASARLGPCITLPPKEAHNEALRFSVSDLVNIHTSALLWRVKIAGCAAPEKADDRCSLGLFN
jgi:hypothetical protein